MNYQPLFDYMHDQHGVILLETDLQAIVRIVEEMNKTEHMSKDFEHMNEFERGIVIVGQGQVGKTILAQKNTIVAIDNEPQQLHAKPLLPPHVTNDYVPFFDGKSARNKRREAERKNKKKRK
jgi:hypothetical protein